MGETKILIDTKKVKQKLHDHVFCVLVKGVYLHTLSNECTNQELGKNFVTNV